jgi:hypothetical protein
VAVTWAQHAREIFRVARNITDEKSSYPYKYYSMSALAV